MANQNLYIKKRMEIIYSMPVKGRSRSALQELLRRKLTSKKPGRRSDLAEREAISSGSGQACKDLPQAH